MRLSLWVCVLLAACGPRDDDPQSALEDRDGDGWFGIDGGGDDCNDDDDRIFPHAPEPCDGVDNDCNSQIDDGATVTLYADADADGFGTAENQIQGCAASEGWALDKGDCDDAEPTAFPGAPEYCDLHDNDCDGSVDELAVDIGDYRPDADGDGYGDAYDAGIAGCEPPFAGHVDNAEDCNDANPAVNPTAVEVCDGNDNDCDGLWNEADPDVVAELVTQYADVDGDGYGGSGPAVELCWETKGYSERSGDCDDTNPLINPGESEVCNAIDDDCDADVDDEDSVVSGATYWYVDSDEDGYGAAAGLAACIAPAGRVANNDDCNDLDETISPSAAEVCDLEDNDCDGVEDNDASDGSPFWRDSDGDGYGRDDTRENHCSDPASGWSAVGGDCDDTDEDVNPGAEEQCNRNDDDCDGQDDAVDPDTADDVTFWLDADGDHHGDANNSIAACIRPAGYATNDEDCDDTDAALYSWVTSYPDEDGDGFGDPENPTALCTAVSGYVLDGSDCDDGDASVHPDAPEIWYDGVDGNCDGANDDDRDHDGFLLVSAGGDDCDDRDPMIHPYAYEDATDGIDNDCDDDVDASDSDPRTTLTLADDDFTSISFSSVTFPFCGSDYGSVWVGDNGYLTFEEGDVDHSESVIEFLEAPRVAGFWVDLDPETTGTIEWIEYADAVGVYFRDIEVYAAGGATVDVGIVLLADGRIVLDYGEVTTGEAIVGWSCGPGDGVINPGAIWPETDLSAWTYTTPWDSLGIGTGTEDAFYQSFTGGVLHAFDTPERSLVYCVRSGTDGDGDGWTDQCGDPDDGDASVTP
jgi:hypothetical protein